MTPRGEYLKKLVYGPKAAISVRELAKRLAARQDVQSKNPEAIRRTLHRHIGQDVRETDERDVSDRYVNAISAVLDIDPAAWPAATPRLTKDLLKQRIAELQNELREFRGENDPPAPAQDVES